LKIIWKKIFKMKINNIKKEFPIFNQKIKGNPLIYLDSANSSQKPSSVINRMSFFYENEYSNVGRSVHSLAVKATNRFDETRDSVKKFFNAKFKEEIVFTKGATEAINLVANSFGEKFIKEGDEIILSELEHHSNYVPWHYLRERKKAVIKFAKVNQNLELELDEIKNLITNKTKIIALTHISNVTGGITPIKEIIDLAKQKKIPVLIDGTQGAPHLKIDFQELDCDFYVVSCHKMYGPNGLGILYGKKKWLDILPPYQGGGGMINEVKKESISFAETPTKFEAGTMQTAEIVAFNESLKFLNKYGFDKIINQEKNILDYAIENLKKINSLKIVGQPKDRASVISFVLKGIHPHDIATILDDDGVAIRAGHHCCQILHEKIKVPATARASLGIYNTKEDIDVLINAINKCKKIFED
tara:strand:+ start:733 stop:1980 length:1248 start_codon:yes stop_codon:yes gene_type:complete